ncbi:PREDICTED: melanoma-associated antigen B10-like [Elephantulus edwardii]|uniref:melanoma-associated antigen B10-like n=1 Tax=Elephantulus edwardii TaxID=28737 RepID=UPI0003F0A9AB|nr:PREDICTED: melanoma-associated antigen B10-like [Elephantulus edwardii]
MPRGHKSKHRAKEKHKDHKEILSGFSDQAFAAPEEARPTSSSPPSESSSQSLLASESCSATMSAPAISCTKANGDASIQNISSLCDLQLTTLEKKVIVLVDYMLSKYQMKEPFTKADILRDVIQLYKHRYFEILRRASEYLELLFGLDLKEMDSNRHIYVLVNKLELSCEGKLSDERVVPKTGLLMTVLGVIFTRGNRASEEQIWEVLNSMGLYAGKNHLIFRDPRKLITRDFVSQKYLEYQEVPNSDPSRFEFLWGPRSHAETTKMKVLKFMTKVHNTNPSAFPAWYEEALRDEEERAKARIEAKAWISAMAEARSKAFSSTLSCPK